MQLYIQEKLDKLYFLFVYLPWQAIVMMEVIMASDNEFQKPAYLSIAAEFFSEIFVLLFAETNRSRLTPRLS